MDEKLQKLHDILVKKGLDKKSFQEFSANFSGNVDKQRKLHELLKSNGIDNKPFEQFQSNFFPPQKKNPIGSASSTGPSLPRTAPVAATNSGSKAAYSWGTTPGIQQPSTATGLGMEQKPSSAIVEPEFIKKTDNRIALSNVRDSRKGDYQSDAVERMDSGLSEKEKQELAEKSLLENGSYDTDITLKRYNAELSALKKDQSDLSAGLDGIDQEISEIIGENAFDEYQRNIESYTSFKEKYDLAYKSNDATSANKYVEELNSLAFDIEKFQQHPLVQERDQMVKAMQKNLDRFKGMESDERYKGVRSMEADRKAIQGQVDEQHWMSDFSGMVIRSVGNMAAGIGRTAKNVNEMVWGEDAEPTPVSNFLIDLGEGANFLFPSPSQYSRGLVTDTAKWNGYEVDFKGGEVQAIRKDGKAVQMQLTDEQISEIKGLEKSKQVNWSVAPYQTANVIVDMGVMLAGADKITKGLTAAKVGEKAAARTGVALSTAGQMANGMYEQGLELFDGDKKKAAEFSFFGSLAIGAVQNVFGLEQRLLTGRALDTKAIAAAVGKMTPRQMAVEAVKSIAKEAIGEGFEEGMIEPLVTAASSQVIGGKNDIDPTEMVSNGAMGFMVGTLFAGGNVNMNELQKSSLYNASKDPVAFEQALRKAVENGEIAGDEEFISQQVSRVNRIGAEISRLAPDLKQEELLDATAVIDEKIKAEARLKQVRGSEPLEERYQAEVDVLNDQLNEMLIPPSEEVAQKISENQAEESKPTATKASQSSVPEKPQESVSGGATAKEGEVLPAEPVLEPVTAGELEVGKTYYNEISDRNFVFAGVDSNGMLLFDKVPKKGEVLMTTRVDVFPDSNFMKKMFGQKTEQASQVQEPAASQATESATIAPHTAQEPISPTEPIASEMVQVPPPIQGPVQEERGEVNKTVVTERAYEGDVRPEIKAYLKEKGLTRDVENQEEASNVAANMVKDLGVDKSVEAVRTREIEGGVASAVLFESMKALDDQMAVSTDKAEIDFLAGKTADILAMTDDMGVTAGRFTAMFARKYMDSDIGWNANAKKAEYVEKFGSITPEVEARFEELESQLREVSKKLAEAEKRAKEAAEKQTIETIKTEAEKKKPTKASIAVAGKELAKKIRKGKLSRPGTFSAASPASIVWDAAIEIAATSIEAGSALAEAIQNGLNHIKASDWYKGLSSDKQQDAEQEYQDFLNDYQDAVGKLKIPKSLIRDLVASGIDNVPDLVDAVRNELGLEEESDREIRDAITEYGKTINMTKDEISVEVRRLRRVGRLISALEDVSDKKRPLRSGLQRDKLTAEERNLRKQLNEEMKGLPIDEETLANEQKTALDAKKARIRNRIEDLDNAIKTNQKIVKGTKTVENDAETEDLIAERDRLQKVYESIFSEKPTPLTEGEKKIAALERQLEKLMNEGAPTKKGEPSYTQEEQDRIDQLKGEILNARMAAGLTRTPEQVKLDQLDAAISETERLINENELEFKKKKDQLTTPAIEAKLELLKKTREDLRELREQAGIFEARRLEETKKRTKKSIEELERRIREKDFAKKERKPLVEDSELTRLRAEKLRIKEEYDKAFYAQELKNRSWGELVKDLLWKAWGLARPVVATGEVSFIMVQGGMLTIDNPWAAKRAFLEMLRVMKSRENHDRFIRNIKAQDWYPLAKQSGLKLTEAHAAQQANEEANFGEMIDMLWNVIGTPFRLFGEKSYETWKNINPFNAVERGAVGYLDTMRVAKFLEMLDGPLKDKNFSENKEDFKSVADVINTLSSRASLGKLETVAEPLTKAIFSPRNWASQVKLFSPYALIYFSKMTPTARKMALKTMTKFLAANTGLMLMAAAMLNNDDDDETIVEFDPRSSDFMKMKFGDRRLDFWGGKMTYVVLTCRQIMNAFYDLKVNTDWFPNISGGGFKNKEGKVVPLGIPYKSSKASDLILASAINKLAPQAAFAYRYLNAARDGQGGMKGSFGDEYTLEGELDEITKPMFWGTIADLKAEDVDVIGTIMMFSAAIGANVSVYGKKEKTKEESKREKEIAKERKERLREKE